MKNLVIHFNATDYKFLYYKLSKIFQDNLRQAMVSQAKAATLLKLSNDDFFVTAQKKENHWTKNW
jgi:hypothetical protein